jgi:hypothetical protein
MTAAELSTRAYTLSRTATSRPAHKDAGDAHYQAAMAYAPNSDERTRHLEGWKAQRRLQRL